MKKNYTKIIMIIDRSGSMSSIKNDVIGGYNTYIKTQKEIEVGTCDVSFYQFDTEYQAVYEDVPIGHVAELTDSTFIPRGGTALLDAVGTTITNVGMKLSALPESERPDNVLVVIITDGQENSSKLFTTEQIKTMVTEQTNKYKWTFTFLGSNQDAWSVGSQYGIIASNTLTFANNSKGVKNVFASVANSSATMRRGGSFSYHSADIQAQKDAGAAIP